MQGFKSLIGFINHFLLVCEFRLVLFEFVEDFRETNINIIESEFYMFFKLHKLFFDCIDVFVYRWNLFKTIQGFTCIILRFRNRFRMNQLLSFEGPLLDNKLIVLRLKW